MNIKNNQDNLVKKACDELGINQAGLAKKLGISTRTVSNWNTGATSIPSNFNRLIELLKIEQNFLKIKSALKDEVEIFR